MTTRSIQRQWNQEAAHLHQETSRALQPLHDDLLDLSPSFDGIVYFAVDRWHENNASAVTKVQPESDDAPRFEFYRNNIAHHRVDLGATALGLALQQQTPSLIPSRMNPKQHTTWTQRAIINHSVAGGLQAAFKIDSGHSAPQEAAINRIYTAHTPTINDVAGAFHDLSYKTGSIGDTLELSAPTTPNAFLVGWDLHSSTRHAKEDYGRLRNYLLDTKELFTLETAHLKRHFHDTGDGQDIAFWLPDGVDRADPKSIRSFGKSAILPLIQRLSDRHTELITHDYTDMNPGIKFAMGLGYVEHDRHDEYTSREYWRIARLHDQTKPGDVAFSKRVSKLLF